MDHSEWDCKLKKKKKLPTVKVGLFSLREKAPTKNRNVIITTLMSAVLRISFGFFRSSAIIQSIRIPRDLKAKTHFYFTWKSRVSNLLFVKVFFQSTRNGDKHFIWNKCYQSGIRLNLLLTRDPIGLWRLIVLIDYQLIFQCFRRKIKLKKVTLIGFPRHQSNWFCFFVSGESRWKN